MTEYLWLAKVSGMIASVVMPMFNIPLVLKIWRRRSSADISIVWTFGIWVSIIVMLPAAVTSDDMIFRIFGVINFLMFSLVVFTVLKFR